MVKKKSGRAMNPADAHRKEQRKKEIKKNKAERTRVRKVALALKDTTKLETELAELKERAGHGRLDKNVLAKKEQLYEKLQKIIEAKKELGVKYEPKPLQKGAGTASLSTQNRDPLRSVYYHPVLNPLGAPPPGKPWREIDDGVPAEPQSPKGGDRESSSDEDGSESDESEESTDVDEEEKVDGEKKASATEGVSASADTSALQPSLSPSAAPPPANLHIPPPLPTGPRPEKRWNLFGELPEHPTIIFDRGMETVGVTPRPPPRPPYIPPPLAGCSRPPVMPGNMPPPLVHPFPPPGPGGPYPPPLPPHMALPMVRPPVPGAVTLYAPHVHPPMLSGHAIPPMYAQRPPPPPSPVGAFPTHAGPGVGPGATPVHPLPVKPSVPTGGPNASTVIAAAPQIRDFQKEITSLVPTHLLRKRNGTKTSSSASKPVGVSSLPGTLRPSVNAAPDIGDDDELVESAPSEPAVVVASIFGDRPKVDSTVLKGTASVPPTVAADMKGSETPAAPAKPKAPSAADEYTRFMKEMGDLLADGS